MSDDKSIFPVPALLHEGGQWCPLCEATSPPGEEIKHEPGCRNGKVAHWVGGAIKRATEPFVTARDTVHYEGKLTLTVKVEVYDLVDGDRGRYVPAAVACERYKKEILAEASPSVRKQVVWDFVAIGPYPIKFATKDTAIRAKVTVNGKFTGSNIGFASMTPQQLAFAVQLKDDIVDLIDEFEPPKSAWVAEGSEPKAQEKTDGRPKRNRSGAKSGAGSGRPKARHRRAHRKGR
jgi:hypothetical protein